MLVDYMNGSPQTLPNKPQEHRGTQPRKPTICPPCKPQIQKFISFCPFEVSQNTEETPKHLKEIFIFATFQPISAPLPLFRCSGSTAAPMGSGAPSAALSSEERKPTTQQGRKAGTNKARQQGTKERAGGKPASPTKKGTPPPYWQGVGSPSPHHKFAPKNQQKVAWGRFEKIFGKIFRWNVSGVKKNPSRYLNGRGLFNK